MKSDSETKKWDFLALFSLALIVRLLWLKFGAWVANDSADYLQIAQNLTNHWTFSLGMNGTPPTAVRPPLFPAMISALSIFGGEAVAYVLVANLVLGSFIVALTYLIAREKFDRRTAILAASFLAFAPMTCRFTVTILTETLFTFLVVLAVFLWGRHKILGAGTAFGMAALARPTILPFLVLIALLPALPAWRRHLRDHLILLIVAVSVASVWMVRNAVVFSKLIPVASSGWGLNLLCGTLQTDTGGRVWNGSEWAPLDITTNQVTRVDDVTDESDADVLRMKRAVSRILSSPGQWLLVRAQQYPKLFLDNGDYLLGTDNLPLREAIAAHRWTVIVTKLVFLLGNILVMGFAAFGIWSVRARLSELGNIILFPVYGVLVHLPMWIEPRYLLPMMPMIFILAAVGIQALLSLRTRTIEL